MRFHTIPQAYAAEVIPAARTLDRAEFAELLGRDPLGAFREARDNHRRTVRDYQCTFVKKELLPRGMSKEQTIAVKFRQEPYSIFMHWIKNQDKAVRVIYQAGRWTDDCADFNERAQAVCQPGAIAAMFVKSLMQPIHGDRAKQSSRRFIDDFGFAKALELMVQFSTLAQQRGELSLQLEGESEFDGRPTWVLKRHVPYAGPGGLYPDATAIYHIDQEWRVPVAVYSFSDAQGKQLLGRYEYRDVKMNAGCCQTDFEPATYGM